MEFENGLSGAQPPRRKVTRVAGDEDQDCDYANREY